MWEILSKHNHDLTVRDSWNCTFSFSSSDRVIGRQLFVWKGYQKSIMQAAMNIYSDIMDNPRQKMLDIGANIGTVCISLIKNDYFKRAIAIEPEAVNYGYLEKNVRQNGLENAIVKVKKAVSNQSGKLCMEISRENYGDHRLRIEQYEKKENAYNEQKRDVVEVDVITIDKLLNDMRVDASEIGLVWIDVQGFEYHVLRGMKKLTELKTPMVLEIWPYGLARADTDINILCEEIESKYRYFYDLREECFKKYNIEEMANYMHNIAGTTSKDVMII